MNNEDDFPSQPIADISIILASLEDNNNNNNNNENDNEKNKTETTYRMPAEWEPHSACLILFPHNPDTFRVDKAVEEIIALATAIATVGKEAVYLLCNNDGNHNNDNSEEALRVAERVRLQLRQQGLLLPEQQDHPTDVDVDVDVDVEASTSTNASTSTIVSPICIAACPSNDTWARDTAPTFVFRSRCSTGEKKEQAPPQELIGLDWNFNAYGGPEEGAYWPCAKDQLIAGAICSGETTAKDATTLPYNNENSMAKSLSIRGSVSVPLILEGGAIHTDGDGTLLTTRECLLHSNRNPHLTQDQIDVVLQRSLGVSKVLWLPHGLDCDDDTNGHVDNFCCFVRPGHVLLAWTDHEDDEDGDRDTGSGTMSNYKRCRAARECLQSQTDAKGRAIEITKLYLPSPRLRYTHEEAASIGRRQQQEAGAEEGSSSNNNNSNDDRESSLSGGAAAVDPTATAMIRYPDEIMAASYINFYIANGAILVPQFASSTGATSANKDNNDDEYDASIRETDRRALETLRPLFPDRTVVGVPSREILLGGGNIHCQTQQVPAVI